MAKIKSIINNFDVFNPGFSIAAYYVFMFGALPLAVFFQIPSRIIDDFDSPELAKFIFQPKFIFYVSAGFFAFIGGYLLVSFLLKTKKIRRPAVFGRTLNKERALAVFKLIFLGGLLIKALRIWGGAFFHLNRNPIFTSNTSNPFYGTISFFDWLGPASVAIGFAFYFYLRRSGDNDFRRWRLFAWSAFAVEFINGFFSGSRLSAALPVVVYLIINNYLGRRSLLRVLLVGLFVVFVVMPLQNFYKAPDIFERSYSSPANVYSVSLERKSLRAVGEFVFDSSIGRIDQMRIVPYIFANTREFLHGKTFRDFFVSFGPPRFLWKNKPISINSQDNVFGHQIGYLSPGDDKTALGPTAIGDLYINFGVLGIIGGMFFLGAAYRFIFSILVDGANPPLFGVVMYGVFWPQFITGLENWIGPVWAGMIRLAVLLLLVYCFLVKKEVDVRKETE